MELAVALASVEEWVRTSGPFLRLGASSIMKTAGDPLDTLNACVVCERATVRYPCKVCKMYFYCSKGKPAGAAAHEVFYSSNPRGACTIDWHPAT